MFLQLMVDGAKWMSLIIQNEIYSEIFTYEKIPRSS